nr:helix-turn-helix domain-containing protein [Paenibacillus periandrae]
MNDSLIHNLLHHIFVTEGKTSVQELANKEVISTRQMNRIFYQWIGASPKRFCDVVRFQAIIDDIQSLGKIDGASLALNHGYFDQAHMIRDFKRFYGESPLVAAREFGNMSDFYNP